MNEKVAFELATVDQLLEVLDSVLNSYFEGFRSDVTSGGDKKSGIKKRKKEKLVIT